MNFISNKGTGPVVVLIHGNSLSAETWERQLAAPELAHLRLIAFDLPGHGRSPWISPGRSYSLEGLAEAVADHIRGMDPVVVVGHSLGGHIVTRVPALAPNVRALMLTGMAPLRGVVDLGEAFLPTPTLAKGLTAELTEDDAKAMAVACTWPGSEYAPMFARLFLTADPRMRAGIGEQVATSGLADELAMIRAAGIPVCIAHGAGDPLLSMAYLEKLAPLFWQERIHVFDEAGHSPQLQSPHAFNALLLDLIRSMS